MTALGDYPVGKGRPPTAFQFKPGVSGNPAGRKRGVKGVSAVIAAALARRVTVTEKGRRRSISLLEAALAQQANKAAAGDRHATKLILQLLGSAQDREQAQALNAPVDPAARAEADAAILEALRASAGHLAMEADDEDAD